MAVLKKEENTKPVKMQKEERPSFVRLNWKDEERDLKQRKKKEERPSIPCS